jgi:hypothetical protein
MYINETVTKKFENQFTKTAIDVAFPLESLPNNSDVINQGIAPI